jgi:hypothetical protein
MASISEELRQWIIQALDLGVGCVGDGDHAPFVMLLDEEGKEHLFDLHSADGVIDSRLVSTGREIIRQHETAQHHALVWDGYLTRDGKKQGAVFVEAGARGDTEAYVFAQTYNQKKRGGVGKDGPPVQVKTKTQHLWA